MNRMSRCRSRSCRASIQLVEHVGTGKVAPVDHKPDPNGNIRIFMMPQRGWVYEIVTETQKLLNPDWVVYNSHFVTCPAASQNRKREKVAV